MEKKKVKIKESKMLEKQEPKNQIKKPLMKYRGKRHKFQSFADRISKINVYVFHIVRLGDTTSTNKTYFYEILKKWKGIDSNSSDVFCEVISDIGSQIETLPELLVQKDRLVEVLIKHLNKHDKIYNLKTILELVVALAHDLRQEFYPHFLSILNELFKLLEIDNIDVIEWTFECLAYLYKYLWKYLVKNFGAILNSVLPLVDSGNNRQHIAKFAVESFSFLVKKFRNYKNTMNYIVLYLEGNPTHLKGCALLLFYALRGVSRQFHSQSKEMLKDYFCVLDMPLQNYSLVQNLLTDIVNRILKFINPEYIKILWDILLERLLFFHAQWKNGIETTHNNDNCCFMFELISIALNTKATYLNLDQENVVNVFLSLLVKDQKDNTFNSIACNCLLNLWKSNFCKLNQSTITKILLFVLEFLEEDLLLTLIPKFLTFPLFKLVVLPKLISYFSVRNPRKVLPYLIQILGWNNSKKLTLDLGNGYISTYLTFLNRKTAVEMIKQFDATISILIVLPSICTSENKEAVSTVSKVMLSLCHEVLEPTQGEWEGEKLISLLTCVATAFDALLKFQPEGCISKLCPPEIIFDSLLQHANTNNILIMRTLHLYLNRINSNLISPFSEKIEKSIIFNILSHSSKIRTYSANMLRIILGCAKNQNLQLISVLDIILEIDSEMTNFQNCKLKIVKLRKLEHMYETIKNKKVQEIILMYLLGILSTPFTMISKPVNSMLTKLGKKTNCLELYWKVFYKELVNLMKLVQSRREQLTPSFKWNHLSLLFSNQAKLDNGLDYRKPKLGSKLLNLLTALCECEELVEENKNDIARLFIEFEENYNFIKQKTFCDIHKKRYDRLSKFVDLMKVHGSEDSKTEPGNVTKLKELTDIDDDFDDISIKKTKTDGKRQRNHDDTDEETEESTDTDDDVDDLFKETTRTVRKRKRDSGNDKNEEIEESTDTDDDDDDDILFEETTRTDRKRKRDRDDDVNEEIEDSSEMDDTFEENSSKKHSKRQKKNDYEMNSDKEQTDNEGNFSDNDDTGDLEPMLNECSNTIMWVKPNEQSKDDTKPVKKYTAKRFQLRIFCAFMKIMKSTNQKELDEAEKLLKLYYELLQVGSIMVQEASLSCILSFHNETLEHYADKLQSLIYMNVKTAKKFKTEYRELWEAGIQFEHRKDVIPIILRLLHGKLLAQTTRMNYLNMIKSTAQCLSECTDLEKEEFFNIVFTVFKDDVSVDGGLTTQITQLIANCNLKKVLNPEQLRRSAFLIYTCVDLWKNLLSFGQLNYVVKLSIFIGGSATAILLDGNPIKPKSRNLIINTKNFCMKMLCRLFTRFETYPWSLDELEAIFEAFVWPYLDIKTSKLSTALKLYLSWKTQSRYFILLGKRNNKGVAVLDVLMNLLSVLKVNNQVFSEILDLIISLLTLQDETNPRVTITTHNCAIINQEKIDSLKVSEPLNYGSKLLIPYLPVILKSLKKKFQIMDLLHSKQGIIILSRISEFIDEPETAEEFLDIVIPNLQLCAKSNNDQFIPVLTTVVNLLSKVPNSERFILKLAPVFGLVNGVFRLKFMHSFIKISEEKGVNWDLDIKLIEDLNAVNPNWIEQPDFERRCYAFNKLSSMSGTLSYNLGVIAIFTCFNFIKTETDLILRENANLCLENICPSLAKSVQDDSTLLNSLMDSILMTEISSGLNEIEEKILSFLNDDEVTISDKKELDSYANYTISHLGVLARKCAHCHPVLKDLSHFTHSNPKLDFFELLKSVHFPHKIEAMTMFSAVIVYLDKPLLPKTIIKFIFPILLYYLFSDTYVYNDSYPLLMEGATKVLENLCKLLPWDDYETTLNYYITHLQTFKKPKMQRTLVICLTCVLDGFHFDLRNADIKWEKVPKVPAHILSDILDEDAIANQEQYIDRIKQSKDVTHYINTTNFKAAVNEVCVLSKNEANAVAHTVSVVLLPKLQNMIHKPSPDVNNDLLLHCNANLDEFNVSLKIAMVIPIVKLVMKMGSKFLVDTHIPGILMRCCSWLKFHSSQVRNNARNSLRIIMTTIGPAYLRMLVNCLFKLLSKGFFEHVCIFTIHYILKEMDPQLQPGDLNTCIPLIIPKCLLHIMTDSVTTSGTNMKGLMENNRKSDYSILKIIAKNVTNDYLLNIIIPIKEHLGTSLTFVQISKIRECLKSISFGFKMNSHVEVESFLQFSYGIISQSIKELSNKMDKKPDLAQLEFQSRRSKNIYIIPKNPRHIDHVTAPTYERTYSHVLPEFGLDILLKILNSKKVFQMPNYLQLLDPFTELLLECMTSQNVKILTLSIECNISLISMNIQDKKEIERIKVILLQILHKYSTSGMGKSGDNVQLIETAFKAISKLISQDPKILSDKEKQTMFLYCEQDLLAESKQNTCLTLLRMFFMNQFQTTDFKTIIKRLVHIAIVSEDEKLRYRGRLAVKCFLDNYSTSERKKDIELIYSLVLSQLTFEKPEGRKSAMLMIKELLTSLQSDLIIEKSIEMFLIIAPKFVQEKDANNKAIVVSILQLLLSRINTESSDSLFKIILTWFKAKDLGVARLAAQLIGIFAEKEQCKFSPRIRTLLPLISKKWVVLNVSNQINTFTLVKFEENSVQSSKDKRMDCFLFHMMTMLVKLYTNCSEELSKNTYLEYQEEFSGYATFLLGYPHVWVRDVAIDCLSLFIKVIPLEEIVDRANGKVLFSKGFLLTDTKLKLKSLILNLKDQLIPSELVKESYLIKCTKLLTHLAKIVKDINDTENATTDEELSLNWMVKLIIKAMNNEEVHPYKSIAIRKMGLNWFAAVALILNPEELNSIAHDLLIPMLKVANDQGELADVAKEALNFVKQTLGGNLFTSAVTEAHLSIHKKKVLKKTKKAQELVTHPERATRAKLMQTKQKSIARKEKAKRRPSGVFKNREKPKLKHMKKVIRKSKKFAAKHKR